MLYIVLNKNVHIRQHCLELDWIDPVSTLYFFFNTNSYLGKHVLRTWYGNSCLRFGQFLWTTRQMISYVDRTYLQPAYNIRPSLGGVMCNDLKLLSPWLENQYAICHYLSASQVQLNFWTTLESDSVTAFTRNRP